MNTQTFRKFLNLLILMIFLTGCAGTVAAAPATQGSVVSPTIADIVARYREEIQQEMQMRHIPGLAIAVVDDKDILWEEGFGYTDWDGQTPVTPSTLFSIQSMSKSFTATAAMIAAQEGLVYLDAPITIYLPDFTAHSIFEEHPEQKMTLRILLSHTAGFPHDPGYGGNYDGPFGTPPYSFEKHITSIPDTWLMFPVGSRYSYSNIGIDLAGYILQVQSGMPFIQYVQKKVLDPLGMKDSTLDYRQVRADSARAIGHVGSPIRPPIDFQLLPSGGVWTSAEDMTHYLQFHINKGAVDGNRLLREDMAETMYTPPNLPAQGKGYALGVTVNNRNNTRHFQHGGGGFGFNSSMVWYPDLKLGSVVLINFPQPDSYVVDLSEGVLESIMMSNIPLYHQRSISATRVAPAYPPDTKGEILTADALRNLIATKALPEDAPARQRRSAAVGTYLTTFWGFPGETIEIGEMDGKLTWSYQGGMMISPGTTLTEVQPGLFFSTEGNLVDLRGSTKLIDNIRLIKENPQVRMFRSVIYTLCGLVLLSALFFWPARALLRRQRRKKAANEPDVSVPASRWLVGVAILAALTSLFGLICLAIIALAPNLIYIRWPLPFVDLAWWQFALICLPYASLLLAAVIALLIGLEMRNRAWKHVMLWYYTGVAVALVLFNSIILA
jgi:CubicO group peptidase (beta-lactamase class C family)